MTSAKNFTFDLRRLKTSLLKLPNVFFGNRPAGIDIYFTVRRTLFWSPNKLFRLVLTGRRTIVPALDRLSFSFHSCPSRHSFDLYRPCYLLAKPFQPFSFPFFLSLLSPLSPLLPLLFQDVLLLLVGWGLRDKKYICVWRFLVSGFKIESEFTIAWEQALLR